MITCWLHCILGYGWPNLPAYMRTTKSTYGTCRLRMDILTPSCAPLAAVNMIPQALERFDAYTHEAQWYNNKQEAQGLELMNAIVWHVGYHDS